MTDRPMNDPTYPRPDDEHVRPTTCAEQATRRLYWFFHMVNSGGPDGSELDTLTWHEARDAAAWLDHQEAESAPDEEKNR